MTIETKLFELRDTHTFIPVVAVLMRSEYEAVPNLELERWLLRRAGYSETAPPLVLLTHLGGGMKAQYDYYSWGGRTYPHAHRYITENWESLNSGDLIDVRVILGEATGPCESEYGL